MQLHRCIQNVIDLINDEQGFSIVGWYKRGLINDRGLVSGGSNNNVAGTNHNNSGDQNQVNNGDISFHVVEIRPTNPNFLKPTTALGERLASAKFDVSRFSG